jgi:multiple sugar transport system permease protein
MTTRVAKSGKGLGIGKLRSSVLQGHSIYLIPAWLLLVAVALVPLLYSLAGSFTNASLLNTQSDFVGFDNYLQLFRDSRFVDSLLNTLLISALSILVQMPIGFGLAVLLNRQLRGTAFFRTSLIMPILLTPVAVGLMWRLMMNVDNGVIAGTLRMFGLAPIDWLGDRAVALWSIVFVDSWQNTPFVMLLILAGLQNLPDGPIEAARVDGAGTFRLYRHVILPILSPVALVVLMIRVVESIKLFDIIYILTSGGPGTATQNISLLDFRFGFTFMQTSLAAALGILIAIGMMPIFRLWKRANQE